MRRKDANIPGGYFEIPENFSCCISKEMKGISPIKAEKNNNAIPLTYPLLTTAWAVFSNDWCSKDPINAPILPWECKLKGHRFTTLRNNSICKFASIFKHKRHGAEWCQVYPTSDYWWLQNVATKTSRHVVFLMLKQRRQKTLSRIRKDRQYSCCKGIFNIRPIATLNRRYS